MAIIIPALTPLGPVDSLKVAPSKGAISHNPNALPTAKSKADERIKHNQSLTNIQPPSLTGRKYATGADSHTGTIYNGTAPLGAGN